MSLVHSTIVGHFDPLTLNALQRKVTRPIDVKAAQELLASFPRHVATRVEFQDGYVECWWADHSLQVSNAVCAYAYRLAEQQDCIAAETPVCDIRYPDAARQLQQQEWQRQSAQHPRQKQHPPATLPTFRPTPPAPCPYCGQPLRTSRARQCRFCKMDWHDVEHVFRRGELSPDEGRSDS